MNGDGTTHSPESHSLQSILRLVSVHLTAVLVSRHKGQGTWHTESWCSDTVTVDQGPGAGCLPLRARACPCLPAARGPGEGVGCHAPVPLVAVPRASGPGTRCRGAGQGWTTARWFAVMVRCPGACDLVLVAVCHGPVTVCRAHGVANCGAFKYST